jgi:hypothetical protein
MKLFIRVLFIFLGGSLPFAVLILQFRCLKMGKDEVKPTWFLISIYVSILAILAVLLYFKIIE